MLMSIKTNENDIHHLKYSFIYQNINKFNNKTKFLKKYCISYSSFNSMKKKASIYTDKRSNNSTIIPNLDKIEHLILGALKAWVLPPQYPLTISKIQQSVFDQTGFTVNKRKIKFHLKNSLNFTYKKGSSRSKIIKLENHKFEKSIFSSRMLKNIYNDKLIVNIDEWSF